MKRCKDCNQMKKDDSFRENEMGIRHSLCNHCTCRRKHAQILRYHHYYGTTRK